MNQAVEDLPGILDPRIPEAIFDAGILDREYHRRLIANLDTHLERAGIPFPYIMSPLAKFCSVEELVWVQHIRQDTDYGLCITDEGEASVIDKMMAIAGVCLRNYIDARVMTVQQVVAALKDGTMPMPTVLLIPNFFLAGDTEGTVASWEVSELLGLLYSRLGAGRKTVLYVQNWKALEKEYGKVFAKHILSHYTIV